MTALRRLALHHRALFAAFVLAALMMRMLTPGGYMFAVSDGVPTVMLCPGSQTTAAPMAMPGMDAHQIGAHQDAPVPDQPPMPCAFAGLSSGAIAAADPLLLAVAIAFVVLRAVHVAVRPRRRDAPYLRPPLRGPPALA